MNTCIIVRCLFALAVLSATTVDAKTLAIGTQCTNPPYNYREPNGAIVGYDIDIAKEIAHRIGDDITISCLPIESMIPALMNNQFDAIFASLSITDERKKALDFSLPYRAADTRFVGRKSLNIQPFINGKPNPPALKGKIVGVQRSTTNDLYMQDKFPGVDLNRYDSVETMLLDLKAGRIDLALTNPIKTSTDFLNKSAGKNFKFIGDDIVEPKILGAGVGAAVRKGNIELLQQIDKAMKSMYDDGTFKKINLKYWNFSVMPDVWK